MCIRDRHFIQTAAPEALKVKRHVHIADLLELFNQALPDALFHQLTYRMCGDLYPCQSSMMPDPHCSNPKENKYASARATISSFSTVMDSPWGNREDKQAWAGLSQLGSPSLRAIPRTPTFSSPVSSNGCRTLNSCAATIPGRWSPSSSAFVPSKTNANPRSAAMFLSDWKSSRLHT